MIHKIPGIDIIEIKNVVLDYNGTIAIDGKLIDGVAAYIQELSSDFNFFVLTADTYGSVITEVADVNCEVVIIDKNNQDLEKLYFVTKLGREKTLCVGNGKNDALMLKEAVLGFAVIQEEGLCVKSLIAADVVCNSVIDVFEILKNPNRLKATLRN